MPSAVSAIAFVNSPASLGYIMICYDNCLSVFVSTAHYQSFSGPCIRGLFEQKTSESPAAQAFWIP